MEEIIKIDLGDISAFQASYEKIYGCKITETEASVIIQNLTTFLDIIKEKYNL